MASQQISGEWQCLLCVCENTDTAWPSLWCVESIEKDSEGIPGWKERVERLCVYRDELKRTVDVQLELAKVQLGCEMCSVVQCGVVWCSVV